MSLNPSNSTNKLMNSIYMFFSMFYLITNLLYFNFIKNMKIKISFKNNMKNYNKFI